MDPPGACPDPSRLRALLGGDLPADQEPALIDHLEGCPACRTLFDGWSDLSGLLEDLDPQEERRPRSPVLERVLNDLKARPVRPAPAPDPAPEDDAEEGLPSCVGPSDRPGSLGRIGPYEVVGLIGRGGMGVVLKALDPGLNRIVAVKLLASTLATSPRARRRFLREARAAAAVCHEHVVTIHAVDEVDGVPYLVMQYVDGRSLQEKIEADAPLPLTVVLRIGMQVAAGLAAAHAQGLVHRDIKPANILLENGVERARITDFGLARAATDASVTQSGTVAGTPQYMAPEQARGEPVDHRTDLYSLGGVLYAMVTGQPPFDGDSTVAVLRRVSDERPQPVTLLNPDVPPWLAALIDRLMARDPAARYQTAALVAELLGARLAELQRPGGSVPAAAGPAPAPSGRHAQRVHGTALLAGALALTALAVAVVLLVLSVRRPAKPEAATQPVPIPARAAAPTPATALVPGPVGSSPNGLVLGLAASQRKEYAEAVRCLTEFLRRNPGSTRALLARGDAYRYLPDHTAALADFNEVIRLAPGNGSAYYARAFIRVETKDFAGALADCDLALRLDPSNTWAYFHRALAHNGRKDWDRAIADFGTFIARVPDFAPAYVNRAVSYENRGDLALALADMEAALLLRPNNTGFYPYRGWLRARLADYDGAIADYTRVLRVDPNDAVTRASRACALALAGRYDEAEADFEAALRGSEEYPWPLVRRAHNLHAKRGDYDRAVADCGRMIAIDPKYAEAYFYRGLALLARGAPGPAVEDFDRVLALNQPDALTFQGRLSTRYAELYQARGDARAQLGDAAGAKADHDRAARLRSEPKPTPRPE